MCKGSLGTGAKGAGGHDPFPHLFKLEGEGRESVASPAPNARMFLGSPLIMDCQVTDCSCSMSSLENSP